MISIFSISAACTCTFKGNKYQYGETIYNTTDGLGHCITAICDKGGEIVRNISSCPTTHAPTTHAPTTHAPTTTVFNFSSTTMGNCILHSLTSCICLFVIALFSLLLNKYFLHLYKHLF